MVDAHRSLLESGGLSLSHKLVFVMFLTIAVAMAVRILISGGYVAPRFLGVSFFLGHFSCSGILRRPWLWIGGAACRSAAV